MARSPRGRRARSGAGDPASVTRGRWLSAGERPASHRVSARPGQGGAARRSRDPTGRDREPSQPGGACGPPVAIRTSCSRPGRAVGGPAPAACRDPAAGRVGRGVRAVRAAGPSPAVGAGGPRVPGERRGAGVPPSGRPARAVPERATHPAEPLVLPARGPLRRTPRHRGRAPPPPGAARPRRSRAAGRRLRGRAADGRRRPVFGSLCGIDHQPRRWNETDLAVHRPGRAPTWPAPARRSCTCQS